MISRNWWPTSLGARLLAAVGYVYVIVNVLFAALSLREVGRECGLGGAAQPGEARHTTGDLWLDSLLFGLSLLFLAGVILFLVRRIARTGSLYTKILLGIVICVSPWLVLFASFGYGEHVSSVCHYGS